MKLLGTPQGTIVSIHVKPKSKQFRIEVEDDAFIVYCKAAPVNGKVNTALTKELSKLFGKRVEILSGLASRHKRILVQGADEAYIRAVLLRAGAEVDV
jgi:uncharacterized protein (TIGR00251 family)